MNSNMVEKLSENESPETPAAKGVSGSKSKPAKEKKYPLAYSAWTIGYDGLSAIVDKGGFSSHEKDSVHSLLEAGLFRAAASAAVNSGSPDDIRDVIDFYNRVCGDSRSSYTPEDIYRLFGVQKVQCGRFILL